jgi:hypothetical protein
MPMGTNYPRQPIRYGAFRPANDEGRELAKVIDWVAILRAYIRYDGSVWHQPEENPMSFHDMYMHASASKFVVVEKDGLFTMYNMSKARQVMEATGDRIWLVPKKGVNYTDLDHAIGTTVMKMLV